MPAGSYLPTVRAVASPSSMRPGVANSGSPSLGRHSLLVSGVLWPHLSAVIYPRPSCSRMLLASYGCPATVLRPR